MFLLARQRLFDCCATLLLSLGSTKPQPRHDGLLVKACKRLIYQGGE